MLRSCQLGPEITETPCKVAPRLIISAVIYKLPELQQTWEQTPEINP